MLVHHSGHDSKSRGRGSSAMTAAMDVEYKVTKSDKKVTLSCTKMKDDETPKDIGFDLKSVTLDQDDEGKPITAPILNLSTTFFTVDKSVTLNATDKLTLDTLDQLFDENSSPVSKSDWKNACTEKYPVSSDAENPDQARRKKFDRSLKSLLDKGFVVEDNGCFTVAGSDANTEGENDD